MLDARLSRLLRQAGPSLLTFFFGSGALFATDFLVGHELPAETVASWATLKSVAMPLAAFALFGLDQAVVREPSKWKMIRLPAFATLIGLSLAGSITVVQLGFFDRLQILLPATLLLSICNLYFGLFRADLHFGWAQIARDGWKILFLLGVVAMVAGHGAPIGIILIAALAAGAGLSILRHAVTPRPEMRELFDEVSDFPSALRISAPFALSSIALAIATFGEVAIINALDAPGIIADYFVTIICFVSANNLFNTYLATFLGSLARQHPERTVRWYDEMASLASRYRPAVPLVVLLLPAATFLAGWVIHRLLFPASKLHLSWAILMAVTASTRLAYTFISIVVGALGNRMEVTKNASQYFFLSLLFPVVAFLLGRFVFEVGLAVALASSLHWLGRSVVGFRTGRAILTRYRLASA